MPTAVTRQKLIFDLKIATFRVRRKERNFMEEILKKVVNLGIGAVKNLEVNLESTFKNAEVGINSLIDKGEKSKDENTTKVKTFVDDMLNSVKEYESKVKEVTDNLITTLKEFDLSGGKKAEELSKKVESLSAKLKDSK